MGDQPKAVVAGAGLALERPTWVRWRIIGLILAYVAFCHFNRISMSVAGVQILKDYKGAIQPTTMGMVYSAYLILYTLLMTPGGWLIDRWGPKKALVLMGFGSALGIILTGVVGAIFAAPMAPMFLIGGLLLVRGATGSVSAPIHPAGARLVSHWIPAPGQSGVNGLVTASACVGVASSYLVFGALMDAHGWPAAFFMLGAAMMVLAAGWTFYVTDGPKQHPAVNERERLLIDPSPEREPAARPPASEKQGPPALWRNRSLILLTISYGAVSYVEYLFFYWIEHYFEETLRLPKEVSRSCAMICTLTMAMGMFAGGWLADRLQGLFGQHLGRALVPVGGMVGSALFLLPGVSSTSPVWTVAWLALATAAIGACEGPIWTTAIELGGRQSGTAAGICNTGGNVGGLIAPILTPFLGHAIGWHWAIAFSSLLSVLGAILWVWIDPGERPARQSG